MKRLLVVLFIVALLSVTTGPAAAQDATGCDRDQTLDWLVQRQAWRNTTSELTTNVRGAPLKAVPSIINELHREMEAIADLERPDCPEVDKVMLWTYFMYDGLERWFLCTYLDDAACVDALGTRLSAYQGEMTTAAAPLEALTGFKVEDYLDLRPEGWTWPPETLSEYFTAEEQ